jgi:hypothetical protein
MRLDALSAEPFIPEEYAELPQPAASSAIASGAATATSILILRLWGVFFTASFQRVDLSQLKTPAAVAYSR